jgi:hypothetical protein
VTARGFSFFRAESERRSAHRGPPKFGGSGVFRGNIIARRQVHQKAYFKREKESETVVVVGWCSLRRHHSKKKRETTFWLDEDGWIW